MEGKKIILDKLIKQKHMTLDSLSNELNISTTILKNYSSGRTKPDSETRRKIEMFFGEDAFPNLDYHFDKCINCVCNDCKQFYWIVSVNCNPENNKKSELEREKERKKAGSL